MELFFCENHFCLARQQKIIRDRAVAQVVNAVGGAAVKALVWFWLIDETLSANLVYQDNYEVGSTTPSDEAMVKIMTMVMAW